MQPKDLRVFLGYWYIRKCLPIPRDRTRRFCAAARVFVHWLTQDATPRRRRDFQRESKAVTRAVLRAVRASEMLDLMGQMQLEPEGPAQVADYCEVVVRGQRHLVLRPLSSGALLGPVEVPGDLAAVLDPGVVVNLCLTQADGRWRIQEYGLCYPASVRDSIEEYRGGYSPPRAERL